MEVLLIVGVALIFGVPYVILDDRAYRRAIQQFVALPPDEQAKVGLYRAGEISFFTTLGYKPNAAELGSRYGQGIHRTANHAIPSYYLVADH